MDLFLLTRWWILRFSEISPTYFFLKIDSPLEQRGQLDIYPCTKVEGEIPLEIPHLLGELGKSFIPVLGEMVGEITILMGYFIGPCREIERRLEERE